MRFEIKMRDVVLPQELQRGRDLLEAVFGDKFRQDLLLLDEFGQVSAGAVLHHQVDIMLVPHEIPQFHDVLVFHSLENFDFRQKIFRRRAVQRLLVHHFDRHSFSEMNILGSG